MRDYSEFSLYFPDDNTPHEIRAIRKLMLAMLQRSLLDVLGGSPDEVRTAIAWFRDTERTEVTDTHIPYLAVVDTLSLGPRITQYLDSVVAKAEARREARRAQPDEPVPLPEDAPAQARIVVRYKRVARV